MCVSGLSEPWEWGAKGARFPQILADQLALSQHIYDTTSPPFRIFRPSYGPVCVCMYVGWHGCPLPPYMPDCSIPPILT